MEYIVNPYCFSFAVCKKAVAGSIQHSFYSMSLMALTALKMPDLLGDWSHLHAHLATENDAQHKAMLECLNVWQTELKDFSRTVDERNVARKAAGRQPFDAFNPKLMDCSVSV